jgi:hypothetical protein
MKLTVGAAGNVAALSAFTGVTVSLAAKNRISLRPDSPFSEHFRSPLFESLRVKPFNPVFNGGQTLIGVTPSP